MLCWGEKLRHYFSTSLAIQKAHKSGSQYGGFIMIYWPLTVVLL